MICSILLLITLTSCVSGPLVVDVTQRSYQAVENHDVTLEWTIKTPDGSFKSMRIFCEILTKLRPFILFYLREGVEVSGIQDKRFAGRVKFDKYAIREGRLRLYMSRLRTDDSGLYLCRVTAGDGWSSRECHLNVTAERVRPKPETPNSSSGGRDASTTGSPSQAVSPGWIVLYCVLGLIVVAGTLLGVCYYLRRKYSMITFQPTALDPESHPLEPDPVLLSL
ncbi:hypothetical protein VZT92_017389 [Zoarces viviparus]|uniref:Ig-like domain-containing protein n=1 Tax=Zoarces viviparus TaxID=48416 RepID=A0AAW1ERK5_ZOAVI